MYLLFTMNLYMACSDTEETEKPADAAPAISVDPQSVTFPELTLPEDTQATEIIAISNVGDDTLNINEIYLNDDTGPFTLTALQSPFIEPSGTSEFSVVFTPESSYTMTGSIFISSNDPNQPLVEVPISGTSLAPIIDITPSSYDFGTLYVGCDAEQLLTISNVGTAELIVSDYDFTSASSDVSFDLLEETNGPLPWSIQPNQSLDVSVLYAPYDEIADEAFLTISSSDPYTPELLVTQQGQGEAFASIADQYVQNNTAKSDIIFAVDSSCSMYDDIQNLESNFSIFINGLSDIDVDYHITAVNGTNGNNPGCPLGPVGFIDNTFTTTEAQTTMNEMLSYGSGYGNLGESGLELFDLAIQEGLSSNPNGCNPGLIRDDASLILIGMSDERDQSPGSFDNPNYWQDYLLSFQSVKSNPNDVIIHAIGGDPNTACGLSSPYTGMIEASQATGGIVLNICDPTWGADLQSLVDTFETQSVFHLSIPPVIETIIVQIDGITITEGWTYDEIENSISFDASSVPLGGSTIDITYASAGTCE